MSRARRRLLLATLAGLAVVVGLELASRKVLRDRFGDWILESVEDGMYGYDPVLGWRNTPGYASTTRFGEGNRVTFNAIGARGSEEYERAVPDGRLRAICLGDSFTQGARVSDEETWPARLEAIDERIQAVNLGVGGFGTDQAYLMYREHGSRLEADVVVLAVIEEDLHRMRKSTFQVQSPKPVLELEPDGSLAVRNVPVPTWGSVCDTGWWEEFPRRTSLFLVLNKLLGDRSVEEFDMYGLADAVYASLRALAAENGAELVLVYFPERHGELLSGRRHRGPDRMAAWAETAGVPFVDTTRHYAALPRAELERHFLPDDHPSPAGYRLAAEAIVATLRERFPEKLP